MKEKQWEDITKKIQECQQCPLGSKRTHPVFGEGSLDADIMFIGEAPGRNEDIQGVPFVGRAGKILDKLLAHINLKREEVVIANILKCRPPGNRNPQKNEVECCTPFLDAQIEIIQPKFLIPLGNFSYRYVLTKYDIPHDKISTDHGTVFKKQTLLGTLHIFPMYHPAVATYNPNQLDVLLKDFKMLDSYLHQPVMKMQG